MRVKSLGEKRIDGESGGGKRCKTGVVKGPKGEWRVLGRAREEREKGPRLGRSRTVNGAVRGRAREEREMNLALLLGLNDGQLQLMGHRQDAHHGRFGLAAGEVGGLQFQVVGPNATRSQRRVQRNPAVVDPGLVPGMESKTLILL